MPTKRTPRQAANIGPAEHPPRGLEYVRLDEVQIAARNPKGHDTAAIGRSIAHHGFGEAPLRDERTGRLVAGHGRHAQLLAMHTAGQAPPDGILVDDDGMWRMPVVTGWRSRSDIDAEAYLIGSNQITTAGGWDDGLADVLRDLQTAGLADLTGFTDHEIDDRLSSIANENPFDYSGEKPPEEFREFDDNIETNQQCPKCGYEWSGPSI